MDFPQYRKRFDNKSFYKILNERTLEEVQLIGDKSFIHRLNADKYFELMFIQDLLEMSGELYLPSTKEEYESHHA
jgi:hypothetical protein